MNHLNEEGNKLTRLGHKIIATSSVLAVCAGLSSPVQAASTFTVTQNASNSSLSDLVTRITGQVQVYDALLNGSSATLALAESLPTTGYFTGGSDALGVDTGVILTADATPTDLSGVGGNVTGQIPTVNITFPAPGTLQGSLFSLASTAFGSDRDVHSASTLEFKINLSQFDSSLKYLKLTYSLVISESGSFDSNGWGGPVFLYPDGVGIFVKTEADPWGPNQNCAVIPTTSTYIAMKTAGIVDELGSASTMRQVAQTNYNDLVANALPGVKPVISADLAPNPDSTPRALAPPKIAYSTGGELGIGDQFVTVPLTCVVDVSSLGSVIEFGIVVANLSDAAVPPALLIAGNSLSFSASESPVFVDTSSTPPASAAAYTGPISTVPVSGNAGTSVTLSGQRFETITALSIAGQTVSFTKGANGSLIFTLPAGLAPGRYDLVLTSSFGVITLQSHLTVLASKATGLRAGPFTKMINDAQVKMYFANPIGKGKVSFRVDGKEVAWYQSTSSNNGFGSKLLEANGGSYLVRTVQLSEAKKKALEIFVDGVRVWRAAYKAR